MWMMTQQSSLCLKCSRRWSWKFFTPSSSRTLNLLFNVNFFQVQVIFVQWMITMHHDRTYVFTYNFKDFMNKNCCDVITRALRLTNTNSQAYHDCFWKFYQMIKLPKTIFLMCISLLSLSTQCIGTEDGCNIWGWMLCPCKLLLFGNKCLSVCCGKSGVILNVEIVDENDCSRNLWESKFEDWGGTKIIGILLRMLKK